MTRVRQSGFTLVEVLVTLAIMGVVLGLVAVAGPTLAPPPAAEVPRRIGGARAAAIEQGRPVTLTFSDSSRVTLYPDGSATPARIWDGAVAWVVDPWTAEVRRE
jgi:prepilin-type N-terminal cleavage/methylation domain-containing protein